MPKFSKPKLYAHKVCTNCGDKITKTFCPSCGQKNTVGRLNWAALGDGFLSSFIGDGAIGETNRTARYGFLTTLYAIVTRPGESVAEYLEGRRRKYFNPVTILLLMSGFYALIGTTFGVVDDTVTPSDVTVVYYLNALYVYAASHPATLWLVLLPFTAFAYKWIFRRHEKLRYIEYAYMGIFAAIFSISLSFLQLPFRTSLLDPYSGYVAWLAFVAQGWYTVSMFRRLFGVSVRKGIWSWVKTSMIAYTLAILSVTLLLTCVVGVYYAIDPATFTQRINKTFSSSDKEPKSAVVQGVSDAMKEANPPK